MSDLLDGDTRRDAIRVMLRFLADYHGDGTASLSDDKRAERVADIGNLVARLFSVEIADGLICPIHCLLPPLYARECLSYHWHDGDVLDMEWRMI